MTDAMFTMRPRFAFIMPRSAALHTRYVPERFVDNTASQSSFFMRSSRLSRVMPALLTTTVGAPSRFCRSSNSACTDSSLAMSSTAPRPRSARASDTARAPSSVVAVPITTAPAAASVLAIAAPMPRDAPVTRATWSRSIPLSNHSLIGRLPVFPQSFLQYRRRVEAHGPDRRIDTPDETREYLAGTRLDDGRDSLRHEVAHGLGPAYRAVELAAQALANVLRRAVGFDVHVVDDGHLGRAEGRGRERAGELVRRRAHQLAMRRHAHAEPQHPLRARRARALGGTLHGRALAGDDYLPRAVEVDGAHHFALRRFAARRDDGIVVEAENGRHAARARRRGRLHELGAARDEAHGVGERQRARAGERRVLAEAVACHERRHGTALPAPGAPGGDARRQHRGLGDDRLVQPLGRAVLHQLPQVEPELVARFRVGRPDLGMRFRERRLHP